MNVNRLTTKCDDLVDHLEYRIVFTKDKKQVWLGQVETIEKLETLFGEEVTHAKNSLSLCLPTWLGN